MYLNGSKVIAILCITTAISSAIEVLTEVQQWKFNNNKNTSYELNVLNEFLDYYQLHRAIIIYTSSIKNLNKQKTTKGYLDNDVEDKFLQLPLIQKLTENYHIQFVNTLCPNSSEYLLRSLMPRIAVFMKYAANDKEKANILNLLSIKEKFNKTLKWLLLMEGIRNPWQDIEKEIGHLNILIDADMTVAVYRKDSFLDLYDVYKICHGCGSPLEIVYKGNWTRKAGFTILKEFSYGIAKRRNNLKGFPIRATTAFLNKSPSTNMTDLEYLNNDRDFLDEDAMQRKTYQLIKNMENLFNFTFDIIIRNDWGHPENGNWTGIIGDLYNHQAELTLCPLRYLLSRLSAVKFSRNIHTEKIHFLFRHPKHTSIRNIFFQPLADIVWWCVLALIVITILLLAIHVHAEYKIFTKQQQQQHFIQHPLNDNSSAAAFTHRPLENHFDFIVLCIMEAILMQGPSPEIFHCNSTRLLVVSVSIFSILLMQFYGAFIVSSLLSEAPRAITSLQALYNSSLELGMEDVSYNYEVFINNTNPFVRSLYKYRMWNKHTNRPNVFTLEEGAKKIGKGNFAFHVAIDRAYRLLEKFLTESQFCDLQEINFHPSFTFTSGIGMRISTPFYEFVTLAIAMFQEAGLLQYNNKKWEVDKIDCSAIQDEEVEVDLEHFAPALAFLFISMLISILVLIIEIAYKRFLI